MKKTLVDYQHIIKTLPIQKKYKKEELLIEGLLVDKEGKLEIYYAPHNEYLNIHAKVWLIGITPGFEQMSTAIGTARQGLEEGKSIDQIQYECKKAARFSGSLRKNLISMLDEVKLNEVLQIESCAQLFEERDEWMHTTSLVSCPTFVKHQNYTGHTPKLNKSEFLMKFINENFMEEYRKSIDAEKILMIPLGKAVEEVLLQLAAEGKIREEQIIKGFPHPSGANVNRLKQLEMNKASITNAIIERLGR